MNPMMDMDEFKAPSRVERIAAGMRGFVHKASLIPVVGFMLNKILFSLSLVAAVLDSGGAVAKGEYTEGVKRGVSNIADVVVTGAVLGMSATAGVFGGAGWLLGTGAVYWLANGLSAIITGESLPELARTSTRAALDAISPDDKNNRDLTYLARNSKVLGDMPTTNGARVAAVAFAPGMEQQMMTAPDNSALPNPYAPNRMEAMPTNHFTNQVAARRGMTPEQAEQARTAWVNNNRDEYRALTRAAGNQQGMVAADSGRG